MITQACKRHLGCDMSFKKTLIFSVLLVSTLSQAETHLEAKPSQCVTVREGNSCKATVILSWETDFQGRLCIVQNNQVTEPLYCWQDRLKGQWSWSFSSAEDNTLQIVQDGQSQVLAEAIVSVRWLYKKQSHRSGWRLF